MILKLARIEPDGKLFIALRRYSSPVLRASGNFFWDKSLGSAVRNGIAEEGKLHGTAHFLSA